jgi:hypothetical protein
MQVANDLQIKGLMSDENSGEKTSELAADVAYQKHQPPLSQQKQRMSMSPPQTLTLATLSPMSGVVGAAPFDGFSFSRLMANDGTKKRARSPEEQGAKPPQQQQKRRSLPMPSLQTLTPASLSPVSGFDGDRQLSDRSFRPWTTNGGRMTRARSLEEHGENFELVNYL